MSRLPCPRPRKLAPCEITSTVIVGQWRRGGDGRCAPFCFVRRISGRGFDVSVWDRRVLQCGAATVSASWVKRYYPTVLSGRPDPLSDEEVATLAEAQPPPPRQ